MKWPVGACYVPVKQGQSSGVLVVKDMTPGEPEDLVQSTLPDDPASEKQDEDANYAALQLPEPFEYPFDNDST
ncbi:hypothetical protein IWW50_005565 [Coemansia erecta]|nr:hypothetical protein GGF43_006649 [Coemansia sp. RSA 2618]KAJ2819146.1 hypothetical protein IWW50_005565 [Coemansia erecta]